MNKLNRILFFIIVSFVMSMSTTVQAKKIKAPYSQEYGMIVYESQNSSSYKIVKYSFEDYGRKFREEYYDSNNHLIQITIFDGDLLRTSTVKDGDAIENLGPIKNIFNFSSRSEEAIKKKDVKYKKLENKIILGRECEQFEYLNSLINSKFRVISWNGIQLEYYMDGKLMSRTISIDIKNKPKGKFSF